MRPDKGFAQHYHLIITIAMKDQYIYEKELFKMSPEFLNW
jgi:hypothetical protein